MKKGKDQYATSRFFSYRKERGPGSGSWQRTRVVYYLSPREREKKAPLSTSRINRAAPSWASKGKTMDLSSANSNGAVDLGKKEGADPPSARERGDPEKKAPAYPLHRETPLFSTMDGGVGRGIKSIRSLIFHLPPLPLKKSADPPLLFSKMPRSACSRFLL